MVDAVTASHALRPERGSDDPSSDDLLNQLRTLRGALADGEPGAARRAATLLGQLDAALSHGGPPPAAWIVTTPGQHDTLPISEGPDGTLMIDVDVSADPDLDSTPQPVQPSWGAARAAASQAITQVENNADPEWVDKAREALLQVACTKAELTADDVWAHLGGTSGTHEPRALGAIIRYGRRAGWLERTGRQTTSTRVVNHGRPTTVWASTLHVADDAQTDPTAVQRMVEAIRAFAEHVPDVLDRVPAWNLPKSCADTLDHAPINF